MSTTSGDDARSTSSGGSQGQQAVEFDFDDPEEGDFHIAKALCQRALDGADIDSSSFADILIDKARRLGACMDARLGGSARVPHARRACMHCAQADIQLH